jgi:hypothetical protein
MKMKAEKQSAQAENPVDSGEKKAIYEDPDSETDDNSDNGSAM